ncbi:MAG: hypothetical protein QNJ69_04875 [Gammaproteobacteria bacterium]|nr:hypothetical protein [Gammaproteobacteria bacterium]
MLAGACNLRLIVYLNLYDLAFKADDRFQFLALMPEINFPDTFSPMGLFFDFADMGSRVSLFDYVSDLSFAKGMTCTG